MLRSTLIKILAVLPLWLRKGLLVVLALVRRPMTLGVRVAVRNEKGEVLLVRHTYIAGWHLPGGAIERGETFIDAAVKELFEEVQIVPQQKLELFYVYRNLLHSRFDHVMLLTCDDWQKVEGQINDGEIAEIGFFALDALPQSTTEPTVQRLAELYHNQPIRDIW